MAQNIWEEKQFVDAHNNPALERLTDELDAILKEAGITPAQVWDKVAEMRAAREATTPTQLAADAIKTAKDGATVDALVAEAEADCKANNS